MSDTALSDEEVEVTVRVTRVPLSQPLKLAPVTQPVMPGGEGATDRRGIGRQRGSGEDVLEDACVSEAGIHAGRITPFFSSFFKIFFKGAALEGVL